MIHAASQCTNDSPTVEKEASTIVAQPQKQACVELAIGLDVEDNQEAIHEIKLPSNFLMPETTTGEESDLIEVTLMKADSHDESQTDRTVKVVKESDTPLVQMASTGKQHLILQVLVNGNPVGAIVNTGAQVSVMFSRIAAAHLHELTTVPGQLTGISKIPMSASVVKNVIVTLGRTSQEVIGVYVAVIKEDSSTPAKKFLLARNVSQRTNLCKDLWRLQLSKTRYSTFSSTATDVHNRSIYGESSS